MKLGLREKHLLKELDVDARKSNSQIAKKLKVHKNIVTQV